MNENVKGIYTTILVDEVEMTSDISMDKKVLWIYDVGEKEINIMYGFELRKR